MTRALMPDDVTQSVEDGTERSDNMAVGLRGQRLDDSFYDELVAAIDALVRMEHFEAIDAVLEAACVLGVTLPVRVALLTATLPFHTRLTARAALVETVREQALAVGGEKKVRAVLGGLE